MNVLSSMLNYLLTKAQAAASKIGTATMTTTATTLTGAVNELDAKHRNNSVYAYSTDTKSLGTSYSIVPMGAEYVLGSSFLSVSDGGYRCLKTGTVLVSAYVYVSGATSGDMIALDIGRYNGGWVWTSVTNIVPGTTERSGNIANMPLGVNSNDIIYLRARNITAARGTITGARLVAEYV